jgi:hypothetical protein
MEHVFGLLSFDELGIVWKRPGLNSVSETINFEPGRAAGHTTNGPFNSEVLSCIMIGGSP